MTDRSTTAPSPIARTPGRRQIVATADPDSPGAFFCAPIEGMSRPGGSGVDRATLLGIGFTSLAAVPITGLDLDHLGTDDRDRS